MIIEYFEFVFFMFKCLLWCFVIGFSGFFETILRVWCVYISGWMVVEVCVLKWLCQKFKKAPKKEKIVIIYTMYYIYITMYYIVYIKTILFYLKLVSWFVSCQVVSPNTSLPLVNPKKIVFYLMYSVSCDIFLEFYVFSL